MSETISFNSEKDVVAWLLKNAPLEEKCPAIEAQARIDFLKRLSSNAYALQLKRAYRNIMVALGGRMMERDFGCPYHREIVY